MADFPDVWQTPNGELYVVEKIWPACEVLATAYGVDTETEHPVIWTNRLGSTRVFATTLGHHNETMQTDVWLNVVANGVRWVTRRGIESESR